MCLVTTLTSWTLGIQEGSLPFLHCVFSCGAIVPASLLLCLLGAGMWPGSTKLLSWTWAREQGCEEEGEVTQRWQKQCPLCCMILAGSLLLYLWSALDSPDCFLNLLLARLVAQCVSLYCHSRKSSVLNIKKYILWPTTRISR